MNKLNIKELIRDYLKGEKIEIKFQYPSDDVVLMINSLLSLILTRADLVYILDTIITIVRELIFNSVKSNAKRIYFHKLNLNINDDFDYNSTIKNFKKQIINNFDLIKKDLSNSSYTVTVSMINQNDELNIIIENNTSLLPIEEERISHRKEVALECENFTEAYDKYYDSTEGAGLGIILSVLLLKNAGIEGDRYYVESEKGYTRTYLKIPYNTQPIEITSLIKNEILEEVHTLPTFPENIIELRNMCDDPTVTIDEIAKKVLLDPSLTADVLRLSNSAGFVYAKRIETIEEAIKVIGLKNFVAVLSTTAARHILDKRYQKFEDVWNHCNKIAFYSKKIADFTGKNRIAEQAALSGLLHDIGKIVLLSLKPDLISKIHEVTQKRKIRVSSIMEEITIGISHSEIGSILAEKWNFPQYITDAIRHHHSPLKVPKENRDIVSIVYLANMLSGIETNKYTLGYIDSVILENFNLTDRNQLLSLSKDLKESYQSRVNIS